MRYMKILRNRGSRLCSDKNLRTPGQRASITLEASLIFPLLLLIMLQTLLAMHAAATEINIKNAAHRLAKETGLMLSAERQLAGEKEDERNSAFPGKSVPDMLKNFGMSEGFTIASANEAGKRFNYWLSRGERLNSKINYPKDLRLYIRLPSDEELGRIKFFYSFPGFWENVHSKTTVLLNDWRGKTESSVSTEPFENGKTSPLPDNIWSLEIKRRGRIFQEYMGSNLPEFHPVVSKSYGGNAEMIKSIDLTKPTYLSEYCIRNKADEWVRALLDFKGTEITGKISRRKLTVIIPENSPVAGEKYIRERLKNSCGTDINFEIIRIGRSE